MPCTDNCRQPSRRAAHAARLSRPAQAPCAAHRRRAGPPAPAPRARSDGQSGPGTPPTLKGAGAFLETIEASLRSLHEAVQALRDTLERQQAECAPLQPAAAVGRGPAGVDPAEQSPLRFFFLGQFKISLGEHSLPSRHFGKGWSIMKYLASQPHQPVHRDVLIEQFWPQVEPRAANNRLRVAMHHLRHCYEDSCPGYLPEECIVFRDGCYFLNPQLRLWTDVGAFRSAWLSGLEEERRGNPAAAMALYRRAEWLYQGDFLEEDRYEEWALVLREELKNIYLTILDKLALHDFHNGDLSGAAERWRKLLARDAWREDIYRHLMRCYSKCGQRNLALYWYDRCREVLRSQLDLEPEPETVALNKLIRRGEELGAEP